MTPVAEGRYMSTIVAPTPAARFSAFPATGQGSAVVSKSARRCRGVPARVRHPRVHCNPMWQAQKCVFTSRVATAVICRGKRQRHWPRQPMKNKRQIISALILALSVLPLAPLAAGQVQQHPLRVKTSVPVRGERPGPLMVPLKCDVKGNVYVRGYRPDNIMAAPVVKISPEGERLAVFDVRVAKGFEKGTARDFAIGLRGDVLLLSYRQANEPSIVRFRENGEYSTTIDLQPPFYAVQVAAFPSGDFLVSGLKRSTDSSGPPDQPYTALYDHSGKLLSEITLPDSGRPKEQPSASERAGLDPTEEAARPDSKTPANSPQEIDPAVSLGIALVAEDGNLYLLRAAKKPIVYVISPGGELIRRLELVSPGEEFEVTTLRVAGGRLLLQFGEVTEGQSMRQVFSLFDAEDGDHLVNYFTPPEVGGALACYTPNGFTFIASDKNRNMIIQRVTP
jgi:hypothetical protein